MFSSFSYLIAGVVKPRWMLCAHINLTRSWYLVGELVELVPDEILGAWVSLCCVGGNLEL
jgi:hypothetical protein